MKQKSIFKILQLRSLDLKDIALFNQLEKFDNDNCVIEVKQNDELSLIYDLLKINRLNALTISHKDRLPSDVYEILHKRRSSLVKLMGVLIDNNGHIKYVMPISNTHDLQGIYAWYISKHEHAVS